MKHHFHKFEFESELNCFHTHKLKGITLSEIGFECFHFHYYYGCTSYLGHYHCFSGITGMPIKTEFGHIHKIQGSLQFHEGHDHNYKNVTFEDVENIYNKIINEAFA